MSKNKRMIPYNSLKHRESLYNFISGWMEGMDDLPDGAWQAVIEEGVEEFSKHYLIDIDSNDGFHEYLSAEQENESE